MKPNRRAISSWLATAALAISPFSTARAADGPGPAAMEKKLYCVGYAHLDTQWRWTYPTTIDVFIKNTLLQNFERFEKYPGYVFNFTGSARYAMMKEYYPAEYERLREFIRTGRWFVAGSSVDEGDVNVPSPESIVRNVLYGNGFFRREFGVESRDYMLPDCFGFPASLPSILAHCGLGGFSTQKLTWGSAVGIPFNVGVWVGPDGRSVLAALNPGEYVGSIKGQTDRNDEWAKRIDEHGRRYGVWADYHYYGVGDEGGAPREEDVRNYSAAAARSDGAYRVVLGSSSALFEAVSPEQRAALPRYRGDLLLTEHSAGTLTSQAYMKRWNRKNECLADAAERMATAAAWLGGGGYPRAALERSWVRFLGSQMHDMLPGTALPESISYAWNDEVIALNGFADVLLTAASAVAGRLDTNVSGIPLVVYNPLAIEREDVVEATVDFGNAAPASVKVFDAQDREIPSQVTRRDGSQATILIAARVPPVGCAVFDVRGDAATTATPAGADSPLKVSQRCIENERYRVRLSDAGDVVSIVDKLENERELLAGPAELQLTYERPREWPAWNMDWKDRERNQFVTVGGPAEIEVVESGPVRAAIRVRRQAVNSTFIQTIRLARGDAGHRIEWACDVDWQSTECALRAAFSLTVSNPLATYNLGLGVVQRGNNDPRKYEVPSREWFDLTDRSGRYGVSVLEDCKFGSDKPSDGLVRLTLLYTPGVRKAYMDQHSQDWGRHEFVYGLYGHARDWRDARSEWQGRRLNQPLRAFQAGRHAGPLGRTCSFARLSTDRVDLRALKLAEAGDEVIVRLQELTGESVSDVALILAGGIETAYEVDGQERRIGDATVREGQLVTSMSPFALRSFACRLVAPAASATPPPESALPLALAYDDDVISTDADRSDGRMGAQGRTLSGDLWPRQIESGGVLFKLGSAQAGAKNAVACRGQTVELPAGAHNVLYLLAAATELVEAEFVVGAARQQRSIPAWTGKVGQFDCRQWERQFEVIDHHCDAKVIGLAAGYIRRDPIAWFSTHRHHPEKGNESYQFSYLFRVALERPAGTTSLTLPDDPRIRVFAATLSHEPIARLRAAAPLYDDFSGRGPLALRHVYPPPPPPVFDGQTPIARVEMDRNERFEQLTMGPPRADDAAAASSGAVFRFFDGEGDYPPHWRSGAKDGGLPRLNDGRVAENDDDTEHSVWYDNEGRFHVDLGRSMPIAKINSYSWHSSNRAPQYFSLWGSNADALPSPAIAAGRHDGWTLLAVVDSRGLGSGGCHGTSVLPAGAPLGPYRHLLWVTEDVGEGAFFSEIDVIAGKP